MTPAEIEAALRARYPTLSVVENGRVRVLSPAEYEARIAEMVAAEVAAQAQATEAAAEATRREQAKALYDALKAGTATVKQTQSVVAWLLRQQIRELAP